MLNVAIFSQKTISTNTRHSAKIKYDDIYPNRKHQVIELIDVISSDFSCSQDSGYSICIDGEWGSGKTSLINAVVDKIKSDNKIKVHEIRINAMELDDASSLITYFFACIKEIFKKTNIYTGIASEYKKLVTSTTGILVDEKIGDFVSKLTSGDTNYRDNKKHLSDAIAHNLNDTRILIIVDDIDRCSPEIAKTFLFFVKEVATMSHCVSLFLVDSKKLKTECKLESDFCEKFFNRRLTLANFDIDDYLKSNDKEVSIQGLNYKEALKNILTAFDNQIKTVEQQLTFSDDQKKKKEQDIEEIKKRQETFMKDITNPRRINMYDEQYSFLQKRYNRHKKNLSKDKLDIIEQYQKKIEPDVQFALLSLIYALYKDQYSRIENIGMDKYLSLLKSKSSKIDPDEEQGPLSTDEEIILLLLKDKWGDTNVWFNDYKHIEIIDFIKCICTNPSNLAAIVNINETYADEYAQAIINGQLPSDIKFAELIKVIYTADHIPTDRRQSLIEKAIDLCVTNNKDYITSIFTTKDSFGYLFNNPNIRFFDKIEDVIKTNKLLIPANKCEDITTFVCRYSSSNAEYILDYLRILVEYKDLTMWDDFCHNVGDIFHYKDVPTAFNNFCTKIENYIGSPRTDDDKENIQLRLQNIVDKANAAYKNSIVPHDVRFISFTLSAYNALSEMQYLIDIYNYMKTIPDSPSDLPFDLSKLTIETLSHAIESYSKPISDNHWYKYSDLSSYHLGSLLRFICETDCMITKDEYEKLHQAVINWSDKADKFRFYFWNQLVHIEKYKVIK